MLLRPKLERLISLTWVVLLQSCAGQSENHVSESLPPVDLATLVSARPMLSPARPERLSDNLDEIEACMLRILVMTPDIENPTFGFARNSSGETGPSLEYGYKGYTMRFAVSKSREDGHDIYTLGSLVPGIGYERIDFMIQFLQGLAADCGARTLIISG